MQLAAADNEQRVPYIELVLWRRRAEENKRGVVGALPCPSIVVTCFFLRLQTIQTSTERG